MEDRVKDRVKQEEGCRLPRKPCSSADRSAQMLLISSGPLPHAAFMAPRRFFQWHVGGYCNGVFVDSLGHMDWPVGPSREKE